MYRRTLLVAKRSLDVDLTALALVLVGLLALAGISVFDAASDANVALRAAGMAGLMVLLGIGLWRRDEWARRSAIIVAVLAIHAQMMHLWLLSEVPTALYDGLRGVAVRAVEPQSFHPASLPTTEAGPAAFGLLLCLAAGWLVLRLLSVRVRAEFLATPPAVVTLARKQKA